MRLVDELNIRKPFFDGWDVDSCSFEYKCNACGKAKILHFNDFLEAAWSWKETIQDKELKSLSSVLMKDFSINDIGNGMNTIIKLKCSACDSLSWLYFTFYEYSNSCYRISFVGLVVE